MCMAFSITFVHPLLLRSIVCMTYAIAEKTKSPSMTSKGNHLVKPVMLQQITDMTSSTNLNLNATEPEMSF